MKTFISIISLACLCLIPTQAQTVDKEALYIYQTDGKANIFFRSEVTAISLEMKDGVMHQVVYTGNKQHYFAISKIQSMSFVNPDEDNYRPQIIGDENSPTFGKAIDLGLPSGTKWASFNVGASRPEEYGGYYAWGETEEKDYYAPHTYQYAYQDNIRDLWDSDTGSYYSCRSIGSDITGTQYDVAHVKRGSKWCMPTYDNIKELFHNCIIEEWTTLNGVGGRMFTSIINGNSIFFPGAGVRRNGDLYGVGSWGYYWSSTQHPVNSYAGYDLFFDSGHAYWYYSYIRSSGQSVRPVVRN